MDPQATSLDNRSTFIGMCSNAAYYKEKMYPSNKQIIYICLSFQNLKEGEQEEEVAVVEEEAVEEEEEEEVLVVVGLLLVWEACLQEGCQN